MWEKTAKQCRLGLFQDSVFAADLEDSKSTSGGTRSFQSAGCARIPALDLWDLIVTVLHGNTNQSKQVQEDFPTSLPRKKIRGKIDDLNSVDFISSNVTSSRQEALLHVFEDNEAVIKMIIKGRRPTMRHVSRTHRVALDWLFDRIKSNTLTPKNQLANVLTKGNFTDEWNHLLFVQH